MGFVQHGPESFCSWWSSTEHPIDRLPVELDWRLPVPEPGQPITGTCKSCGRYGVVYEPPGIPAEAQASTAAFRQWLKEAIADRVGRFGEPPFVGHRGEADVALLGWHQPVEIVRTTGRWRAPEAVQECRECGSRGGPYPCRTLRMVAAPYRFDFPGHRREWLP
ncbi:hypothetical protein [Planomonospora sp. ID82291]|uniref:hypothetical protein n=1 Tax=Planomonospora sp. ID82291 TaxID=2738136 RepID=UPI0018C411E2|nr:hypothetical protein [Planomonospora sp. ID82291]MBG0818946.1 hypothetical protein [Planomonospora sp. ID82291]